MNVINFWINLNKFLHNLSIPPPAMTVAIKMIVVPTNIMIPNNVSDRATARNPPINTYTSTEK